MEDLSQQNWYNHEQKLGKIRKAHKDNPAELKKQLDRFSFQTKPTHAHFLNIQDGLRIRSQWQRGSWRSKYSIAPTEVMAVIPQDFPIVAILPFKKSLTVDVWDVLPDTGIMKVRALAARSSTENKSPPTLSLLFGHQVSNNSFASETIGSDQEILSVLGNPQFLSLIHI